MESGDAKAQASQRSRSPEACRYPGNEESLIRHYSLSPADRLEIELRRRNHNRLGFAIQLCLMRYPGRVLGAEETPPRAMLKFVADQIGAAPAEFALYARREETRRDHMARLMVYLDTRSANPQDRRAALLAAIQAASLSDDGAVIASSLGFCRKFLSGV